MPSPRKQRPALDDAPRQKRGKRVHDEPEKKANLRPVPKPTVNKLGFIPAIWQTRINHDALAIARANVAARLRARDALNALHGRMKGGVAR